MANEARVFAEGPDNCKVVSVVVPASTAVPKGSLLIANGDRTAALHVAAALRAPLGFAVSSITSSDANYASAKNIGVQTTGVVEAYADGTINTGNLVCSGTATANRVSACYNGQLSLYDHAQIILGRALTNATDGNTVKVALNIFNW